MNHSPKLNLLIVYIHQMKTTTNNNKSPPRPLSSSSSYSLPPLTHTIPTILIANCAITIEPHQVRRQLRNRIFSLSPSPTKWKSLAHFPLPVIDHHTTSSTHTFTFIHPPRCAFELIFQKSYHSFNSQIFVIIPPPQTPSTPRPVHPV